MIKKLEAGICGFLGKKSKSERLGISAKDFKFGKLLPVGWLLPDKPPSLACKEKGNNSYSTQGKVKVLLSQE